MGAARHEGSRGNSMAKRRKPIIEGGRGEDKPAGGPGADGEDGGLPAGAAADDAQAPGTDVFAVAEGPAAGMPACREPGDAALW